VVRLIGRGGFAEVFEVVDTDLQRRLAVKVLRSDLPWSVGTITRFKQEARAIARLNHPNTVPIHFVGEGEGLVYYAMPYLEGRTVTEVLRAEGPLSADYALRIVEPILDALQHAHDHGLVHRDVKPDNILLESATGRPLLVDFGIVKYLDGPAHLTESGFIVGTPLYMSPEQALGSQSVDARSDVYGMGAVLFQLLTGAPPFEGTDSQEIVGRHIREPVSSASLSRDNVPPWISAIVLRCMAKHPDDRYPTARAALEAIRAGRAGAAADPVSLLPRADESPTETMPVAKGRPAPRPWMAGAAAAALVGAVLVFSGSRDEDGPGGDGSAGSATHAIVETAAASPAVPGAQLVVENRLAEPIALSVDDTSLTIRPGDQGRLRLPNQGRLEASWAMVQPIEGDRMLGERVEGAIVAEQVEGEIRRVIDAESDGQVRFAPMVVNQAGRPLRVAVVGPTDSVDCDCRVATGDSLRLGYYRYTDGTGLRVTDSRGWSVRLTDLDDRRDPVSGAVVVRVSRADLRPPAGTTRRGKIVDQPDPERRNPLGSFLPVR
jgi:Protein kinase domain